MSPAARDEYGRLTRRDLLHAGAAAGVAAAFSGAGPALAAAASGPPSHLRRSAYLGLEGTAFTTTGPDGAAVTLRLSSVEDLVRAAREGHLAGSDDAFALLFAGPADRRLPAATRTLEHPALGTFALFVTPVGPAAEAQAYEVVVDRSVRMAEATDAAPQPGERSAAAPQAPAPAADPAAPPAAGAAGARSAAAGSGVLRAAVARRGGVLAADVRLDRGRRFVRVRVALVRGEIVVARGDARVRGRAAVRIPLRAQRRAGAGEYTLVVTTTNAAGRRASARLRAWLNA